MSERRRKRKPKRKRRDSCCSSSHSEKHYEVNDSSFSSCELNVAGECDTSITSLTSSSSESFKDLCCTGPVCCPEDKCKKKCKKPRKRKCKKCKKVKCCCEKYSSSSSSCEKPRKRKCKKCEKVKCCCEKHSSSSSCSDDYYCEVDKTKKKCRKCKKKRCCCEGSSSSSSEDCKRDKMVLHVTETRKEHHTCPWRINGPVWKLTNYHNGKKRTTVGGTVEVERGTKLIFKIRPKEEKHEYGKQEFYLTEDCLGGGDYPQHDLCDRVSYGVIKYHVDHNSPRKFYYQSTGGELRGGMIYVRK